MNPVPARTLILAIALLLSCSTSSSGAQSFYVSSTGNDAQPGTLDAPWKTLAKARDHIRTINGKMEGDITVYLRGGIYFLDRPLDFNPADSGRNGHRIIYRNHLDETPWISGGVRVTGWTRHQGDIWKARLDRCTKLRQLYVGRERAIPARSATAIIGQGASETPPFHVAGTELWAETKGAAKYTGIKFNTADMGAYRNPEDVELFRAAAWVSQVLCLSGQRKEGAHRVAELQEPCAAFSTNIWNVGARPNDAYTVCNAFELLDQPGEFYFDRISKTLYYMAQKGRDPNRLDVIAPQSEKLITVSGASTTARVANLRFQGLVFAHTHFPLIEVAGSRGLSSPQSVATYAKFRNDMNCHLGEYSSLDLFPAAVEVRNADSIVFTGNTFQHIGSVGVSFINDVLNSEVTGSFFYDIGAAAVNVGHPQHRKIGEGTNSPLFPPGVEGVCRNNTVANNVLRETSIECWQAPALTAFYVQDTKFWHNDLLMTPYTGISFGWDWASACKKEGTPGGVFGGHYGWVHGMSDVMKANSISYNRVLFTMTKLSDGAAIYTLGYQDPKTNEARRPDDTTHWSELRGNWLHELGGAGYYCDEGSRYWKCIGNAISGGAWLLANPGTRDIRVADGVLGNDSPLLNDPARNLTESNNTRINYFDPPSAWPKVAQDIYENSGVETPYRSLVPDRLTQNGPTHPGVVATQSSGTSAGQALDGYCWQHAAAQTDAEPHPWWQVDLGKVKEIDTVFVHLSTDAGFAKSTRDLWIFVSDEPFRSTDPKVLADDPKVWRHYHEGPVWLPSSAYRVNWFPVRTHGRYVRLQLAGQGPLVLTEVLVLENRAKTLPDSARSQP